MNNDKRMSQEVSLSLNISPDALFDEAGLWFDMYSLLRQNSFSEGLDVNGSLLLFFWLNSGTERQPWGDEERKPGLGSTRFNKLWK